jgi:hypothetical protein
MQLYDGLEAVLVRGEAVKGKLLEAVLARTDYQKIGRSENRVVYPEADVDLGLAAEP